MISDIEIQRLRGLSDEALKAELGRSILEQTQGGLQARPPSLSKLIQYANAWLSSERENLRLAICKNDTIREIAQSEPTAPEKLVRVIADVTSALVIFVPAGTLAEILVRDGISEFCRDMWTPNS